MLEEAGDDVQEKVQQLTDEYNGIGHVPFKEKDKLYKEYHEVLDKIYKELNISVNRRRLDNFRSTLRTVAERGSGALDTERARLMRRYESLKQEIQTYPQRLFKERQLTHRRDEPQGAETERRLRTCAPKD